MRFFGLMLNLQLAVQVIFNQCALPLASELTSVTKTQEHLVLVHPGIGAARDPVFGSATPVCMQSPDTS